MRTLVTGGAGYIGSHVCVELLMRGHEVVVVDDLSNSKHEVINRISKITGKSLDFHKLNLLDRKGLSKLISESGCAAVMHFAGFKAVGESVLYPLKYYQNNIEGTVNLLTAMQQTSVQQFVFSSSATVYGENDKVPFSEDHPLKATNPYGRTKLFIEEILQDYQTANPDVSVSILRYFNPVGAHHSGLIGEDPLGIPNNLMPIISRVAVGSIPEMQVFGKDYPTPDGTCVRDYIHVMDLADGHIRVLEKMQGRPGCHVYNLGTGRGTSVLEMIKEFESATGCVVEYAFSSRRPGDIPISYAAVDKAARELGWTAEKSVSDMCRDTWNWQSRNPSGY